MATLDSVEQDWREIMASKASKWNKRSRRLSHLTISTHSPPPRSRSPVDDMDEVEMDDSSWSETESSVSTGFSRSVRSRATTLSVYSGISCSSEEDLDLDGRDGNFFTSLDDDDDVSTTSEVPEPLYDPPPSALNSAQYKKWVEDDLGLRSFPTKHVDYLSHDWREVDIWASWRHLMSKKTSYNNEKRLENACWRVWGKKRYDLKTVSPESLNWLKDCDVTWLYGPLQPGPIESLKALSLEDVPAPSDRREGREDMLDLKPILKRRSVSEKMLVRSLLSASLLKQATAAVEAERSARARSLPVLPILETAEYHKSVRPTTPALSRSSSTASLRPLLSHGMPDKKRIHFQEQVDQCIALENSESESDSRGGASESDSDSDGGVKVARRTPFSRTNSRSSRSAERRKRIIAKLPSTTLHYSDEDAELVAKSWQRSKASPPPSPSPEALSPSLPATNFMLDIEGNEDVMGWSLDGPSLGAEDRADKDEMYILQQILPSKNDLHFPCLVCKDSSRMYPSQGRIFESRNDWLVHLWTVHQDPLTWAPTTCLWEGCNSDHKFRTAELWLGHVRTLHSGRQHKRQKTMPFEDDSDTFSPFENDKHTEPHGGLELGRKVFGALTTAKDIGSFLLHSAGDPLAAHVEWLRRSKATNELEEDSRVEAPQSSNMQYFRNLARKILGIPIDNQATRDQGENPDQEALVERLAETLSLYEVDISHIDDISDLEGPTDSTSDSAVPEKEGKARMSALYSMLVAIRQSLIQITPPSEVTNGGVGSEELPSSSDSPEGSDTTIVPSESLLLGRDTPLSMVLPIRNTMTPEGKDDHTETEEEETTDYDSSELEDLPSDASACGDLSDASEENIAPHGESLSLALEPMRQALVDRVMDEFWILFNQNFDSGFRAHAGGSRNSSSPSNASLITSAATTPQSSQPRKRQRDDEMGSDDEDGNMSRKPKRNSGPSDELGDRKRFACPFRKHDSRRYSTYSYRVCALSHWDSIARVKEHIYRCHRMPTHCKRCWKPFKNQEQLDTHLTVDIAAMCELVPGHPPEGITTDQERRLRSRKKSSRDQSDEGRWREMYQLLFPGEEVPSPYFEPIRDEMPGSPDSRDLANYEDYMRRELPRLVRTNIEDVVRRDMQPLEAALIGNLVGIIQDCQDRLFRGYRQMRGDGAEASASPVLTNVPSFTGSFGETGASLTDQQSQLLQAAFQPPPPAPSDLGNQIPGIHLDRTTSLHHQPSLDMILSDSGYASELPHFCDCPGPECTCSGGTLNSYTRDGLSNLNSNDIFGFEEGTTNMQWDGWDVFPNWDSLNSVGGGFNS
ncbi:uncharacterized protein LY89DRAFT_509659 [Mollisia scopiformis]|uniref:Nitrogen regulatory protein areA GATA-like domain-containing protein n=1 Tax=Mollisia scopiformis TaxID=149040 RepID=A0A194XFU9_MOLSC|nr:uncharacterized protein LY89DRAFT_509659 [Mollisia scopiformis]KUJ19004.1 hypothetical protein LY89DRAFT_509659 [Mollisia scopiformis]